VKIVEKQAQNVSKILKKSFQKSKCKTKVIKHQLRIPTLSERILNPYGKETKELCCFKD